MDGKALETEVGNGGDLVVARCAVFHAFAKKRRRDHHMRSIGLNGFVASDRPKPLVQALAGYRNIIVVAWSLKLVGFRVRAIGSQEPLAPTTIRVEVEEKR